MEREITLTKELVVIDVWEPIIVNLIPPPSFLSSKRRDIISDGRPFKADNGLWLDCCYKRIA